MLVYKYYDTCDEQALYVGINSPVSEPWASSLALAATTAS